MTDTQLFLANLGTTWSAHRGCIEAGTKGIGVKIRKLRLARGWNYCRMAREAGVSYNTVARLERGTSATRPEILRKIAESLSMTLAELRAA
jgi:transcriptional regulator with XRE-family HTH domain